MRSRWTLCAADLQPGGTAHRVSWPVRLLLLIPSIPAQLHVTLATSCETPVSSKYHVFITTKLNLQLFTHLSGQTLGQTSNPSRFSPPNRGQTWSSQYAAPVTTLAALLLSAASLFGEAQGRFIGEDRHGVIGWVASAQYAPFIIWLGVVSGIVRLTGLTALTSKARFGFPGVDQVWLAG